ncbi:unnamed protein product [Ranitomeya imitator]|uniref:Uncharacterized protein n=1 Tax=Ranitomeya imitator TaxID=111125 RepID=A0ABN9LHW3_9NEOB|nr:unnamed protein product [Ranitomeya imitator]
MESSVAALKQEKNQQQTLKDELKKKDDEWKKQHSDLREKLTVEGKEKEEQRKKHEENESKLNMQITALNENLATLKKEWQSSQRRVGELEKQTDDLRGEIAVLEATVQNNQEDRRALLERYLKSEEEIKKLQAKVVELRKKVDESTYAMEELGRENQSLQGENHCLGVRHSLEGKERHFTLNAKFAGTIGVRYVAFGEPLMCLNSDNPPQPTPFWKLDPSGN